MADASSPTLVTTYGSIIVAVVALVQPWLISLYKRYVRKGCVEILRAGNLEIGFSTFGPTIGMIGALRGRERDVFVKEMRVFVKRRSDNVSRILKWRAFRGNEMTVGVSAQIQFTFASGTSVGMGAPFKYNVLFSEDEFLAEQRSAAQQLVQGWRLFVRQRLEGMQPEVLNQMVGVAQNPLVVETFFSGFALNAEVEEFRSALRGELYWIAGEYDLELTVDTAQPTPNAICRWQFTLNDNEVNSLVENVDACIRDLCGIAVRYNFAFPQYLPGGGESA